jgi:predicted LPLAT superfamily acyltransferase
MTEPQKPFNKSSSGAAWQGRSRGGSLGYRIFIALLRKGGLAAAYRLLHVVGLYYRLALPAVTRPLRYLYRQRMGFSKKETSKLIRRNIHFFGQTLIDKVAVLTGAGGKLSFEEEGVENLYALAGEGRGGIIVSAHLGNWEVAAHMLQDTGTAINVLMYDGEAEQLKALMEQYDRKRSFNIIYVRDDLSHVYEVSAALRRGELVCLHADRFRPGNRTMQHDFLGEPANFPAGPFLLASKLRAPVCFVFAFKETIFRYHFKGWPAKTYEGRGTSGAEAMLHDFVQLLEEQLRLYPHQWFNYYNFWKATA